MGRESRDMVLAGLELVWLGAKDDIRPGELPDRLWYQGMEFSFYGEKERLLEYHPTTIFRNPNSRK